MDGTRRRLASQLCAAVNNGDPRSVQLLLSKGASPNLVGRKGVAAIHLAVGRETEKNMRCLKMLLQHEADPNIRSSEGLTPLHVAAIWGCCQNLKVLLTNGGNPHMKDNEGNTPAKLAEQHDNKRCARLLQQYQFSSADTEEEEDFPHYQYSVCSDQTDMSGYPESDCSFSSSHVGLSSTRLSSLFNLSNINGGPSCRGVSFAGPSVLSSTRISAARPAAPKEEVSCFEEALITKDNEQAAPDNGVISPSRMNAPPEFFSRRASRKSVSFLNVDEYFPVFSPKSPPEQSSEIIQCPDALPFDMAEYPDFLDSDRMASVLPQQGIDVTSPDHVFVFCRDSSESTEEDLEKTVIGHISLKLDDDEPEGQNNNTREPPVNPSERQEQAHLASSSSGTSGSHYSSCESDHYTSCLDPPVPPEQPVFPPVEGPQSDKRTKLDSTESENELLKGDDIVQAEPKTDSKPETTEPLSDLFDKLTMAEEQKVSGACSGSFSSAAKQLHVVRQDGEVSEETSALKFTPSPFVTGRTRSRLSRCSMRTSRTPESLSMASLFEDTLPMPVRTIRQTPRSHGSGRCFNSPYTPGYATESSERCAEGDSLPEESQDTQSGTLSGPSASNSQADTLILHKSLSDSAESQSQSLDDTVVLEKNQDNSIDAYVRNLAEIIRAVRGQNRDLSEDGEMTDDLASSNEAKAEDPTAEDQAESFHNDDVWVTEDSSSRSDSASSSSTSACLSPRRSTEDSDPPCTPGTGCTPRYSMSRLSSCHRPQRLANLSFTPGGRPVIQDLDEPTEYLYTDTEQGHKFIETHVPPTSDTSLSSGPSTSVCDETVLYDWRSLQTAMKSNKGKENQQPEEAAAQEEVPDKAAGKLLTDTRGMTDRELRLRLVELGESPGPISSRTRPTYLRRLCSLMQEENCRTQHPRKPSDHPQKDLGYSPELCRVLQTFQLPSSHDDEQTLCQQFDQPDQNRKWREGIIKSSFNYLLLDPRVTKNLPFRSHTITPQECFQTFIRAIFYVGKGKRSRPYSHLYEALEYYRGEKTAKKLCAKVQHILQVWAAEQGVISLHCFQNVIPVEAYTREACMVEAIGLKMLTNQKRGDFYGVVSTWELKRKRELGINLLYRAMQIFLAEGERQLRPADIRQ
ncbi:ankyrin repeat and LEM domain-containing protein 1 [Fundulus heteroclitus]|uniref:ankyrin repeat and LEM domain-containing protein 1 n=1 Tax=Fundulus heteroclitus TaxID=8078 RepID=UPI00165C0668|nr:ankyrin repeat and LEM domain-containing protein 1 [Fundulus heteroclitus]